MALDAGHVFSSTRRFVIERELGHGGMGIVYQALDLERNTRVALKALTQRDAVNIYRLKNEFRQLADLSHPNLVTLHELCNEGNSWFFTMELVTGKTFDEYVSDKRVVDPHAPFDRSRVQTVAGRIVRDASITLSQRAIGGEMPLARVHCNLKRLRHAFRQLVEGVAALHEAGKLHRDLKPSNVLVTPQGRVVVLDFGLVSSSTFVEAEAQDPDRTVGGCVFGTPAYMSPEQAAGEPITMASDWYAVGSMLYEALTGQLPFDGAVLEILRQKEESEPAPPSDVVRGVPEDLDQLCRELLRRDPSKRPLGSEILRHLTGHSAPPPIFDAQASGDVRLSEVFVGRERHLNELREAFEITRKGRPVTVLVHGLSGMGKSALVRYFANQLIRGDEAVVLRGRCYERETVPYKAFDNIIDALSRYMMQLPTEEAAELLPRNIHALSLLFPVLKRVKAVASARRPKNQTADARELRNQAFSALKDLLLRITDFHPLVMNIDDLHWGDMDSARLLSFLMGPPDPPPLLLIGTYRRDEAENSPFLRYITSEVGLGHGGAELRQIAVNALRSEEAARLASVMLGSLELDGSLSAATAAAEAEGVPFFIMELVQRLKTRAANDAPPSLAEPISLDEVILERVRSMPEGAQRLLEVLSVAAGPLEQGVAISAAGLPAGDRGTMLALRAARLLRTRGTRQTDTAETYHDRVRETIVRNMDVSRIRGVHSRIATALERFSVADPERLVMHYSGAGEGVRAGETAVQAAHAAAAKLAFNRAVELFKRALELLPSDHPERRELYRHIGDALANAGRGAQAAEAYLAAAHGRDAAEARQLRRMAAQQYLRSGRIDEGIPLAAELLGELGVAYPFTKAGAIAGILRDRTYLKWKGLAHTPVPHEALSPTRLERVDTLGAVFKELVSIDPLRGTVLQTRFLREALALGDDARVLQGLAWEALTTAFTGGETNAKRINQLLDQADEIEKRLASAYATATVHIARAGAHICMGRFEGVLELTRTAEDIFKNRCSGTAWEVTFTRSWRYAALEMGGDLSSLLKEAPDNERDAREKGDNYAIGALMLVKPSASLLNDEPEEALRYLQTERALLPSGFTSFHLWALDRTIDAFLYAGRGQEAWEHLKAAWPGFKGSPLARGRLFKINGLFMRGRVAVTAARTTTESHYSDEARDCVAALRGFARPDAQVYASLLDAALSFQERDLARARALLETAVQLARTASMQNFAHYASRQLGVVLGDAGHTLISDAEHALRAMSIRNPRNWARAYASGFE